VRATESALRFAAKRKIIFGPMPKPTRETLARPRMQTRRGGLKRFEIFEQPLLVLVRQLRAVRVALVAVPFFSRIEKKIRLR
jgi:hypothetical protein